MCKQPRVAFPDNLERNLCPEMTDGETRHTLQLWYTPTSDGQNPAMKTNWTG